MLGWMHGTKLTVMPTVPLVQVGQSPDALEEPKCVLSDTVESEQ